MLVSSPLLFRFSKRADRLLAGSLWRIVARIQMGMSLRFSYYLLAHWRSRLCRSQFFFTFRSTPHLDGKHTVFGKLVDEDSLQVLAAMEVQPKSKKDDKPLEDIKILEIVV